MFNDKAINRLEDTQKKLLANMETIYSWRKHVDEQLEAMGNDIKNKTSDYTQQAKKDSSTIAGYKTKAQTKFSGLKETSNKINDLFSKAEELLSNIDDIKSFRSSVENILTEATNKSNSINEILDSLLDTNETAENQLSTLNQKIEDSNSYLSSVKNINDKINLSQAEIDKTKNQIETLTKQATSKKVKIDSLYDEIFGYIYEEDGDEKISEGLKIELEKAYEKISKNLDMLSKELQGFKDKKTLEYEDFLSKNTTSVNDLKEKIRNLLPGATTAGLSHAYQEKRKHEEEEHTKSSKLFNQSIIGLVFAALLPVAVSLFFIYQGKALTEIIHDTPKIVIAFIPLYVPFLWLAVSANKRVKLSKRLIEEYSHKEALSKTFEGLSSQVENFNENGSTKELRLRLLYNIISVSAENPGKLINDFVSTDHPVLEVLDKSMALTDSINKFETVPGLGNIVNFIKRKRTAKQIKIDSSISEGFEAQASLSATADNDNKS